jgi:hypothetical protein
MLFTSSIYNRSSLIFKVALVLLVCFSPVNHIFAQTEATVAFCDLPSPLHVSLKQSTGQEVIDSLKNVLVIENATNFDLAGVTVGIGVFKEETLEYVFVAGKDISLEPNAKDSIVVDIDATTLLPGDYTYRAAIAQGETADLISNLVLNDGLNDVTLTKTTPHEPVFETAVTVNDIVAHSETIQVEDDGPLMVEVSSKNVSNMPIFDTSIDVLLTRGNIPFGTAVSSAVTDQAKLFPGSARSTELTERFVNRGTYTLYVVQHVAQTLVPVTTIPLQIGNLTETETATRIAGVGVERKGEELQLTACLEKLRAGKTSRDHVASVPLQVTQTPEFTSDVVYSKTQSSVAMTVPILRKNNTTTVSLLDQTRLVDDSAIAPAVQSIEMMFDCDRHELCEATAIDVAVDFAQEETVQTSFWFYAGIAVMGLLVLLFLVRRLDPQPEDHDKHHSEHELH